MTYLWGLLIAYGAGLAWWEFSVFFRSDYWTWPMAGQGFIWPWLWWRALQKEIRAAIQEYRDKNRRQHHDPQA